MIRKRNGFLRFFLPFITLFVVIIGSIGVTETVQAAFSITSEIKLLPSDTASNDYFGYSVSISGNTAVVGAYGNSGKGAAYILTRSGTSWSQQAKLTASDGASGDTFGSSVSISGDTAVVGAYLKNSQTGAAYVFTRSGTSWSQQAKLTASDGASGDYFGSSVSISGNTAVVGVNGKTFSAGAAYLYSYISPPVVNTSTFAVVTSTSVTLNGILTSLGTAPMINVSFEYGTTTSYGNTTPSQSMTTAGAFSANITGLSPDATCHFRAKADGGTAGIAYGSDMTFTPSQAPPTTTTTTPPTTTTTTPPTTSQAPPVATPSVSTNEATNEAVTGTKSGIPKYVWILVAGAAVGGLGVTAVIMNKRKAAPVGVTATAPKSDKVTAPPTTPTAIQPDYTDTLRKLNELRKEGVITEEELAARKKELLDKM